MTAKLHFGVVGTGAIATDFLTALAHSDRCRVVSLAGISVQVARAFADRHRIAKVAPSVPAMLEDPDVHAVYIAVPHVLHESLTIACIEAGKHVLCEKPLAMDTAGASRVIAAARRRSVFVMEGFMYRCHPVIPELMRRLQDGAIGDVCHLRADFGFRCPRDPEGRLFDPQLGGGGIRDVGGYPVSLARLIAGTREASPFAEPVKVRATGVIGPTGVDELALAHLTFRSGMTAEIACSIRHDLGEGAVIFGEQGRIVIPNPWLPGGSRQGLHSSFTIYRDDRAAEVVNVSAPRPVYALEAELIAESLPRTEPPWPAMGLADSLGNLRVLDEWRAALEPFPSC